MACSHLLTLIFIPVLGLMLLVSSFEDHNFISHTLNNFEINIESSIA